MDEAIKWLLGGGFFTAAGMFLKSLWDRRKIYAEAVSIELKASSEAASSESKRQIDEKDAALRQMYDYVAHVKEWLASAHTEIGNTTKERDNDRRNLEDVKTKFDKLDRDYQDVRVELARERANNAKLAQEKAALEARLAERTP